VNPQGTKESQGRAPKDARLEEYRSLRDEIGRNSQLTANVFLANVTATGVLFGFGFETTNGIIFLSPFAILIPSLFFLTSQLESTTRIASYIKVVLEPELDLGWERDWWEVRLRGLLPRRRKYTMAISGLYGALSATCFILAWAYWEASPRIFVVAAVPLVILVSLGVSSLTGAFSRSRTEDYDSTWGKLHTVRQEEAPYCDKS